MVISKFILFFYSLKSFGTFYNIIDCYLSFQPYVNLILYFWCICFIFWLFLKTTYCSHYRPNFISFTPRAQNFSNEGLNACYYNSWAMFFQLEFNFLAIWDGERERGIFQIQRKSMLMMLLISSWECLWVTFISGEIDTLQSHHLNQNVMVKCIH